MVLHSNLDNFERLFDSYCLEDNFCWENNSGQPCTLIGEVINRMIFSLITLKKIWNTGSKIYTRDIFFLFILGLPIIRKAVDRPVIYECHNLYDYTWKFPRFMESIAIKRADKIFAVSKGVENSLLSEFNISEGKIFLKRNCVDLEVFNSVNNSFHEDVLDPDKINILYAGSDKAGKGVQFLIDAFKDLDDEKFKLVLAGSIENRYEKENIEVLEWLPESELFTLMRESDVLVLPSTDNYYQRTYTSPMKLLEYMASKSMVLASDLPTSKEIAKDTVMYFKPGKSKELSKKLEMLEYPDCYEGDIDKAYRIIEENYLWNSKSDNIIENFKTL